MDVEIRFARRSDFQGYVKILSTLPGSKVAQQYSEVEHQRWDEMLNSELMRVVIAETKEKIVGIATMLFLIKNLRNDIMLHNFVVDPDYRGLGVGERILDFIKEQALGFDSSFLQLQTQQPRAVDFYRKNGFAENENLALCVKITPPTHTSQY